MKENIGYREYKPLLDYLIKELLTTFDEKIVSIVLYGSIARGKGRLDSDVDLLFIWDDPPDAYWKRMDFIIPILVNIRNENCWKELEIAGITPELNVLIFSRKEADQNRYLYLDMIEEAHILIDKNNFFKRRLKKFKKQLQKIGAKKVWLNGAWYWDLKPDLMRGETIIL